MTARGKRLLERHPAEVDAALRHPRQDRACRTVRDLIEALRSLESKSDFFEYQRLLFSHLMAAERAQAEAARNVKRELRGKPVPGAESGDWSVELLVADREVRQLRAVGDALAWRCFRFDRRFILALSRNRPAGPMTTKSGLEHELGEVVERWKTDRLFTLLHGITNALRIADVTVFAADGPKLIEIKSKPGHIPREQFERIQRAIDVINEGAPLPSEEGDVAMSISSQQFRTRLTELRDGLAAADREGVSSLRLGRQWVVTCLSLLSPDLPTDFAGATASWSSIRTVAFKKAGLDVPKQHHLRGVAFDQVGLDPASAPFAIYPFDPYTCARLICDLLTFETVIAWERLAAAFELEGFDTECLLPERSGPANPENVLSATLADRGVTIHGSGVGQILFELVDPRRYAKVVREILTQHVPLGVGIFTFANERATWR